MPTLSAKELGLRVDDTDICLRVPPISASSCIASPNVAMLNIARRTGIGIYGPADAHTHEDWIGSGGVPTPNVAGQFTVVGAGSLKLTVACGYDQLQTDVPLGLAPAGPPTCWAYHRANTWYPGYGPNEGVFDWRGFEQWDLPLTAPEACTLSVIVVCNTYNNINDNHLTDASRSLTFTNPPTQRTATFSVPVVAGAQTAHVCLMAPSEAGYPFFERVVSIAISGFANGAWVIAEPSLVNSSVAAQAKLKTFEGYEYHHGGGSVHRDAAFEVYDADENNAGHANFAELTVRFFDYVEGAVSGLDLTTAYALNTWADYFNNVGDAFNVSRNDAAYYAAVRDDETPPNVLSSCWGFDVVFPWSTAGVDPQLEQEV